MGGNPADIVIQASALGQLGFSGKPVQLEHLNLNSPQIDFTTPLYGQTYIGVHWGAGTGGPANGINGGVTAFFVLNFAADANIKQIVTKYSSTNSGAVLFATQLAPPVKPPTPPPPPGVPGIPTTPEVVPDEIETGAVPEPATWAMMILGFGIIGSMLRRRRALLAPA